MMLSDVPAPFSAVTAGKDETLSAPQSDIHLSKEEIRPFTTLLNFKTGS
jgi:hypothetical protein